MRPYGLALLGGISLLSVAAAYVVGRHHGQGGKWGRGAHLDAAASTGREGGESFWRLEVELAAGSRGADAAHAEGPAGPDPTTEPARGAARIPIALSPAPATVDAERSVLASLPAEESLKPSLVSGPLLEGWYENGQLHFRGHQVQTQTGEWLREGEWEAWHENGTLHELGGYRDDVEHGDWKWTYPNGARMAEGRFDSGDKVGGWLFWHENGRQMMEGAYTDGLRSGPWIFHHENGVRAAAGSFAAGQAVGEWTFWTRDGVSDPARNGFYEDGERVRGR